MYPTTSERSHYYETIEATIKQIAKDRRGELEKEVFGLLGATVFVGGHRLCMRKVGLANVSSVFLAKAVEILDENSLKCLLSNDVAHD